MAVAYNQLILIWLDKNGKQCTNFIPTQDQDPFVNTPLEDLADAAQALSVCGLQAVQFQQTIVLGTAPTTGTYQTVYDRANFQTFAAGVPGSALISLPGPRSSIFQADTIGIDMSDPLVTDFVAAALAAAARPSGVPLTSIPQGRRSRVKTQSS